MQTIGGLTNYVDVAQMVLYAFWLFFAGLIIYLRMEDKREGYPLLSETADGRIVPMESFPNPPSPKTFQLRNGETYTAPPGNDEGRDIAVKRSTPSLGSPFVPTGDPMKDGVGPASYAMRADEPDMTFSGELKIVPLRVATDHWIEPNDPDPRGMTVVGADDVAVGTVTDLWVDRTEPIVRYIEVALGGKGGRTVLVPMLFADIVTARKEVKVDALPSSYFAGIPGIKSANEITVREEDRISGYFGGGRMYATKTRAEPLL
ncbi:Photosynthetic reaction center H subunit [Rhodovulum sp. PH10]|uniref:photosynthetic reaction center subunit H n=1 Tax=Rhodovulum sp. PH10 TaxID=1187851 RepID=UPI00027C1FDC|nr:photosynthetic reaction center subunit H [Rhodovulum sp. PH10]EJW12786.1 Photosynthetic reaction center H subunit [Rhodovulum sp. PH10]